MSKKTRDRLILLGLAIFLLAVILLVERLVPDNSAGLREIVNRDDNYYRTAVFLTRTAEARATYTPTP